MLKHRLSEFNINQWIGSIDIVHASFQIYSVTRVIPLTLVFMLLLSGSTDSISTPKLDVSTNDLSFKLRETGSFTVYLNEPADVDVTVTFKYEHRSTLHCLPDNSTIPKQTKRILKFNVTTEEVGHNVIFVKAEPNYTDVTNGFVRVNVYKNDVLIILSTVIGWTYFVIWTISFYPQLYINWKRKCVTGLSFDYLSFNLLGYICYSSYNLCLKFLPSIQHEYFELFPTGVIPVEMNDVFFAVHALIITLVLIFQCCIYERGGQKLSRIAVIICTLTLSGSAIFFAVVLAGVIENQPWLSFLFYLSYVKVVMTTAKYIPQAYLNYLRRSTVGWSVENVLLDFTGGALSILQMIITASNFKDWASIFGNFAKFGLGIISIMFNILFMLQHYCIYPTKYNRF